MTQTTQRASKFPHVDFSSDSLKRAKTANMSDYEDDMDVDAPVANDNVIFSSDNTSKGKRSAANLPVEAEDSLPW